MSASYINLDLYLSKLIYSMILLNDDYRLVSNEHIVCFYRDLTGYWYRFLLPAYSAMSVNGKAGIAE